MVPQSSATLHHDKQKHAISVKGDHSTMVKLKKGQGSCYPSVSQWIKEDLKNATEVFNGLYSKAQSSNNQGENRNTPSTEPRTALPLLSVRNRVDTVQSPPGSCERNVLAPEPATPSSSENASDSEEEGTIGPDGIYTRKYVRKHNTKRNLLVIIGRKVYDLSSFVDEHPYVTQSLSMNSILFLTKC
jgi:hypothetical protein